MSNLAFVALLGSALLLAVTCGLLYWLSTSVIPHIRVLASNDDFRASTEDWMSEVRADLEQMGEMLRDQVDERDRRLHERLTEIESIRSSGDSPQDPSALTEEVEELKSAFSQAVTPQGLQSAIVGLRAELQTHLESLASRLENAPPVAHAEENAEKMTRFEERLATLEKTFSDLLAEDESEDQPQDLSAEDVNPDVLAELTQLARGMQQEVAASREQVRQAHELTLETRETAQKLNALEESVAAMATEVSALKQAMNALSGMARLEPESSPSTELTAQSVRMEGKASDEQPARAKKNGGSKKGPKLISSQGRAKYREVVSLFSQGQSIDEIALKTGIETAEIELMLAGQRKS